MRDPHALIDCHPPSDLDFQRIFAMVPTQLMVVDRGLGIVYANAACLRATPFVLSEIQGRPLFDVFPETPERVAVFRNAFARAFAGEPNVVDRQPFRVPGADGELREMIWTCSHTPIADGEGRIPYVMQNSMDVTDAVRMANHNAVLLREFGHRVKNTMATVQAVARRSLVESKSIPEAREDLLARIRAMANVHDLLVDHDFAHTDLRAILDQALAPFRLGDGGDRRIAVAGPPIHLSARQAQALSMAFHELATNALKYGALSDNDGRIAIAWSHDPQANGTFELSWVETGGPPVVQPQTHGFGTVMLASVVSQEIGGRIELDFPPTGVVCRMQGTIAS